MGGYPTRTMVDVDGTIIAEVTSTSAGTMGQVLVLISAGVLLWRLAILDKYTIGQMSKMCYTVLSPALLLATAYAFEAENLVKWIVLPVACLAHMGIAALLAKIGARIARLSAAESKMTLLACGFHNLGILPFVFVAALSRTWDRLSERPDAESQGFAMVYVYSIPWMGALYSVGLVAVRSHVECEEEPTVSYHPASDSDTEAPKASVTSAMGADDIRLVEMSDIAQTKNEDAPTEQTKTTVQLGVVTQTCSQVCKQAFVCWANAPQTRALVMAMVVGLIPALRWVFFGSGAPLSFVPAAAQTLGTGGIAINTIVLAANLSRAAGVPQQQDQEASGTIQVEDKPAAKLRMSVRAMAVCCCVKLLLAPLVCTVGTLAVLKSGLLVDSSTIDPLLTFILLVQPAMPSAQSLVVLYNNEGHSDGATRLSSVYIVQYVFAVVTMSFWVIVSLMTVESFLGPT